MTPRARFSPRRDRTARLHLEGLEAREVPAAIGALDPSFGTAGKLFQNSIGLQAVALEPDGKVVAIGNQGADFVIVRYNPDGTVDTGFGTNGIQTIDFAGGSDDVATDVAVQPDGKIVAVGFTLSAANGEDFAIARLNTDGSLDTGFGTGGKVTVDFAGGGTKDDEARAVAIAPSGDIFVAGSATNAANTLFGVAKLSSAGAPVTGFGNNGHEFLGAFGGTNDTANGIALQPDGKVVVAGTTNTNGNDFAIARIDPTTGALDTTFNTTGAKTINFGLTSNDQANDVAVQADGKIVVVGNSDVTGDQDAAAARLNTDGSLDTSFGTGGLKTVDLGGGSDTARRVLIQQSGRIDLVGNNDGDIVVAQLLQTNGALDTSFNGTGMTTTVIGSSFNGNGGALTPDGRIVAAGTSNSSSDGALARVIGTVERPLKLSVGGSLDGRAGVFAPDFTTGQYGSAASTAANVFQGFNGQVRSAVGDVNGDGVPDVILVTGPGTAVRFAVLNGKDLTTLLVSPTAPFAGSENFTGGGFVSAADIDNDGRAEIILTPDQGGGPRVTIYSLNTAGQLVTRANFFGIDDPNFRGGARASAGDVNGDGVADLAVAAGFLGGPRVALFDGKTVFGTTPTRLVNDFFAFPGTDAVNLRNGAFVSVGDVNGDGKADLVFGGGPGGAPRVFILSGALISAGNIDGAYNAPVANFFVAGNSTDRGGVRVATTDADGDNKAEVVAGSGEGSPARARVYLGKNFTTTNEPSTFQDLTPFGGAALADGIYVG